MIPDWLRILGNLRSSDPEKQREAFWQIQLIFEVMIISLCRAAGRRDHEDVLQELMIKILLLVDNEMIENVRPDTAHAYFSRIARNLIADGGRLAGRDTTLLSTLVKDEHQVSPNLKPLITWPLPNGESREDFLQLVRDALSQEEWELLCIWANAQHHKDTWTDKARERGFKQKPGALRVRLARIIEKIRRLASPEPEQGTPADEVL